VEYYDITVYMFYFRRNNETLNCSNLSAFNRILILSCE